MGHELIAGTLPMKPHKNVVRATALCILVHEVNTTTFFRDRV